MTSYSLDNFVDKLRTILRKDVSIAINRNKRTFISFNSETNKLSIHEIFLQASDDILKALKVFIEKKTFSMRKKY